MTSERSVLDCPYCGVPFAEMPKRKRKCPACKQAVYITYTPTDAIKRLMTESMAEEVDRLWAVHSARKQSLQLLHPFGFGERELEQWISMGNTESQAVDLLITGVAKNCPDLHQKKMAYLHLALRADEAGKAYRDYLIEARRCELLRLKQSSAKKVEIMTSGPGRACAHCKPLNGNVWDIDEALTAMPLPHPKCTGVMFSNVGGFCACQYVPDISHLGA
jgi:hypothetical protein